MGIRINQNVMAMNAYRNLTSSEGALSKSLEKLSSGFRINRAADDASGLVISEGLRAQVTGLKMAVRNAQDGVSVVQTAEGALTEVSSLLQRIRELAVQAASTGASDTSARNANQSEVVQLLAEVDRIAQTTKFGGQNLLDGTYGVTPAKITSAGSLPATASLTLTAGVNSNFNIDIDGTGGLAALPVSLAGANTYDATVAGDATRLQSALQAAIDTATGPVVAANHPVDVRVTVVGTGAAARFATTFTGTHGNKIGVTTGATFDVLATLGVPSTANAAPSGSGGSFQVGAGVGETITVNIAATDSATLGLAGLDVANSPNPALTAVDAAVTKVSTIRGDLGASQNRLEHTIANLSVTTENLAASESRIRDTDMAAEMMSFTRAQILQQAGTAMLAQANAVPQTVLQLLQQR